MIARSLKIEVFTLISPYIHDQRGEKMKGIRSVLREIVRRVGMSLKANQVLWLAVTLVLGLSLGIGVPLMFVSTRPPETLARSVNIDGLMMVSESAAKNADLLEVERFEVVWVDVPVVHAKDREIAQFKAKQIVISQAPAYVYYDEAGRELVLSHGGHPVQDYRLRDRSVPNAVVVSPPWGKERTLSFSGSDVLNLGVDYQWGVLLRRDNSGQWQIGLLRPLPLDSGSDG